MNFSNKPDFFTFAIATYITGFSTFLNWIINQQRDVDPWKELDVTSSLAFAQMIFWGIVLATIFILVLLKNRLTLVRLVQFFLVNLIALSSGLITASISTSLKTHIQYFGDLQGDLGVHIQMATNAFINGWEYSGYPPLFPTLVGNAAHLYVFNNDPGLQVVSAHKFISIHTTPLWAGIVYALFRFAFPVILAEVLVLITVLSINTDGWKNVGEIGTELMILILIKNLYEAHKSELQASFLFRVKTVIKGIAFGLFVTLYFGRLWWIAPALALIIFLSSFIRNNRHIIQLSIHDFLLGALIPLTPMFMASKYAELNINLSISKVLIILILFIGIWIGTRSELLEKLQFLRLSSPGISVLIILAILKFEINDTYFDPGMYGNIVNFLAITDPLNLVTFSLLLVAVSQALAKNELITFQISFIVLVILSSLGMMLYYAYEMLYTKKVELWPRAGYTIRSNVEILIVVLIYVVFNRLGERIKILNSKMDANLQFQPKMLGLVVVSVLISLYVSDSLGSTQWSILSR